MSQNGDDISRGFYTNETNQDYKNRVKKRNVNSRSGQSSQENSPRYGNSNIIKYPSKNFGIDLHLCEEQIKSLKNEEKKEKKKLQHKKTQKTRKIIFVLCQLIFISRSVIFIFFINENYFEGLSAEFNFYFILMNALFLFCGIFSLVYFLIFKEKDSVFNFLYLIFDFVFFIIVIFMTHYFSEKEFWWIVFERKKKPNQEMIGYYEKYIFIVFPLVLVQMFATFGHFISVFDIHIWGSDD